MQTGNTNQTEAHMFKVWVLPVNENAYVTNGLQFETVADAMAYGNGLLSRWFGADKFKVLPNDNAYKGSLSIATVEENAVKE